MPRRRNWRRTLGQDWSSALSGMFLGILGSGLCWALAFLIESVYWSTSTPWQKPGASDIVMILVLLPTVMAAYGTAIALVPMTLVMGLERILRVDSGAIVWTVFGLLPSMVLGSIVSGGVSGGIAMAAGGVGGLTAWTRRQSAQDDGAASWGAALVVCVLISLAAVAISLQLPPPRSD